MLDQMIAEINAQAPAVRSVGVEEADTRDVFSSIANMPLFPDQRRWLTQAADAMRERMQASGVAAALALTQGSEAGGGGSGQSAAVGSQPSGSLLGPLALRPGQEPDVLALRPQNLPTCAIQPRWKFC